MKKYFMAFISAIGVIIVLNIFFNVLVLLIGVNSKFHRAIAQPGSLIHILVYGPSIYFVGRYIFRKYRKIEQIKKTEISKRKEKEIFSSKFKKVGVDLYGVIGEVYTFISCEINKIDELKKEIKDDALFSNELLFILFFFSTVKIQECFDNKKVTNKIFNSLHNAYFSDLENTMKLSKQELQNIRNILNYRYASYLKAYKTENMLFDLAGEFLRNIKVNQTNNMDVIMSLSFWFVKANEMLNEVTKKMGTLHKIS